MGTTAVARRSEILGVVEKYSPDLTTIAPRGYTAGLFLASLKLYLGENERLALCTEASIVAGMLHVAQCGLVLGESCDLLPFKNKKTGQYDAVFFVRAAGVVELAYASGVQSIQATVVYEGDEFEWIEGTELRVRLVRDHKPGAKITDAFALAQIRPGAFVGRRMTRAELIAHKSRFALKPETKSATIDEVPWYCEKTLIHRIKKYLPKNARFAMAMQLSREPEDLEEVEFEVVGSAPAPAAAPKQVAAPDPTLAVPPAPRDPSVVELQHAADAAAARADFDRQVPPEEDEDPFAPRPESGVAPASEAEPSEAENFVCTWGHEGIKGKRLGDVETKVLEKSLTWARANSSPRLRAFIDAAGAVLAGRAEAVGQEELPL